MDHLESQLRAYSQELHGTADTLTMESLVASHRYLRGEAVKTNDERRAELAIAREQAAAIARQYALENEYEYVSVERLKSMTLLEVAELISSL